MSKVWLITGCSSGFGSEIAQQALARGDTVIATARNPSKLTHLSSLGATTLALDVTAPGTAIEAVIATAISKHSRIDILVNNAGAVLEGAIEETSDAEAKANFNVNVFGTLAVTRAVLPYMRKERAGVIAGLGSVGGWYGSVGCGVYCSTKWALAGLFDALKGEVKHLGIEVTLIEPGYFRTDLLAEGNKVTADMVIDEYKPVMDPLREALERYNHNQPGDPVKGSKLIVEALTGTGRCEGRTLPLRLGMGSDYVATVEGILEQSRKNLEDWKDLSLSTDF
ncbi:3-oxoacyl-reductase [Rhexocercosporidium sp. MPI-PUGE-AT-0058]|nr:3-oxoacyl-reductase [Rhexocercosporidium sp. MPI-PUGE-AT-0058]